MSVRNNRIHGRRLRALERRLKDVEKYKGSLADTKKNINPKNSVEENETLANVCRAFSAKLAIAEKDVFHLQEKLGA